MTENVFDQLPLASGVPVPMCFCDDPCKVAKSDEEDTYRQRYWMCSNFAFEPTLCIGRGIGCVSILRLTHWWGKPMRDEIN